jgi:hypothetical protein
MLAYGLAHDLEPAGQRGIAKRALSLLRAIWPDGRDQRLLRIGQLCLSLANAAARQTMDSLDLCMAALLHEEVETHGARF